MNSSDYKIYINKDSGRLSHSLKELLEYKDLIFIFVKRDFISSYKQTVLGPVWAIIYPLVNTVIYTIVFSDLARLSTADTSASVIPAFLFYMASNAFWSYFSSVTMGISNTFLSHSGIMSKVYYPRLVTPIAVTISNLVFFGIQFFLFIISYICFYAFSGQTLVFHLSIFMIIPVMLHGAILAIGCGLFISAFTTKYRDLSFALGFAMQLWHYLTPVVYGLDLVSTNKPEMLFLYMLNPLTPVIVNFRYAVFGQGFFSPGYTLISIIETAVITLAGLKLFNMAQKNFIDTI